MAQTASAEPSLCVLVPHFKDEYWLSVADGIETRAAETGLAVRFFEAGGYGALASQIAQLSDCAALDPGAILIGAVSSDDPGLLQAVAKAAQQRPVVGLVNALQSDALAARVGVDWTDMGLALGRHLAGLYPASGPQQTAILLSGPAESGWVAPLETGLRAGLAGSGLSIGAVYRADTGTREQLALLETALAEQPRPDVLIGPAPAIEAAMGLFPATDAAPVLAATYISHSVARGLVAGRVAAAPFDDPIRQGRMAVDAAIEAIAGRTLPGLTGPGIRIIPAGAAPDALWLAPAEYFPTLD